MNHAFVLAKEIKYDHSCNDCLTFKSHSMDLFLEDISADRFGSMLDWETFGLTFKLSFFDIDKELYNLTLTIKDDYIAINYPAGIFNLLVKDIIQSELAKRLNCLCSDSQCMCGKDCICENVFEKACKPYEPVIKDLTMRDYWDRLNSPNCYTVEAYNYLAKLFEEECDKFPYDLMFLVGAYPEPKYNRKDDISKWSKELKEISNKIEVLQGMAVWDHNNKASAFEAACYLCNHGFVKRDRLREVMLNIAKRVNKSNDPYLRFKL